MYYFIVNYQGGGTHGRAVWKTVRGLLKELDVPYRAWKTKGTGYAAKLTTELVKRYGTREDPVKLVVVGGDGTINDVLNGITDFDRAMVGVIPAGSGNDFVRGFRLPKKPVPALFGILNCDQPERVDLGRATADNGRARTFGISAGIGLDAEVCKAAHGSRQKQFLNRFGLGKLIYLLLTVEKLFTMKTTGGRVIFNGNMENVLWIHKLIFLAGMNARWEGGGVPMAPKAETDDGLLSSCVAAGIPRWMAFLKLPVLVMGKQKYLKGFTLRDSSTIDVEMEQPVTLHVDGEYGGEVRRVHLESLPGKLMLLRGGKCPCCGDAACGGACGDECGNS